MSASREGFCPLLLLLLLLLSTATLGVVVQRVATQGPAVAGQTVQIECQWSEGSGPPLYSLRWCKDNAQFFVVTLVPEVRKVLYPVPGVQVVVGASDEHHVTLTNLTHATSGTFTCEAMSDGPAFFSSARSTEVFVLEAPAAGPIWRGLLSAYHLDQHLKAHCHVFESRPPALFTFFINGLNISKQSEWHVWNPPIEQPQEAVWNSSSTLSFPLSVDNIQKLLTRESKQSLRSISLLGSSRYQSRVWSPQYQHYTFTSTLPASHTHTKKRSTYFSTHPEPHTHTQDRSTYFSTHPDPHTHTQGRSTYFSTHPEPHTHTQDRFTSFSSLPALHTHSYTHTQDRSTSFSTPPAPRIHSYTHTRERSTPSSHSSRSVHPQRLSSPNTLRLNLTCIAKVGELSFKTTTWSAVSLPSVINPNGLMKSSGNAGSQHFPSLGMFVLPVLYYLRRSVCIT